MNHPKKVRLVEVGPRDGLQNEAKPVSVESKVRLRDALSAAGHSAVEAGHFVSPKWVPVMVNNEHEMAKILRKPGVSYPALRAQNHRMEHFDQDLSHHTDSEHPAA